jgi:hypothetical protein
MNIGEVGWGDVDWIGLSKDRNRWRALVNSVLNLRVPRNVGKLNEWRSMMCLVSEWCDILSDMCYLCAVLL